ncbi:G2-specific serine/threonine protein kinase [Tulasnella sp. 403]|nr:G2-specific serine/threonine protein kinase [Tulasnella sp. 403]
MNQPTTQEWLDEYEVLDVIGNGMFGVIKKVRNKRTGEILARKDLNFEKMTERDRKQIVAEVNILKDLNHPNIVRYHDRHVDRENGYLYILMEYCGGGDLGRLLAKARKQGRPLPEDIVWRYFYQLLLALQHCHYPGSSPPSSTSTTPTEPNPLRRSQQILHRDIKPENVFLSDEGQLKLGDFGLSKQMGPASLTNTYVGTPYYMSPEMLNERAYDSKSDIWSLGCLIFELCALLQLHAREEDVKRQSRQISEDRASIQRAYDQLQRDMTSTKEELTRERNTLVAERTQLNNERHQLEEEVARAHQKWASWPEERTRLQQEREAFARERAQWDAEKTRLEAQFNNEMRAYAHEKQVLDQMVKDASTKYEVFEREKAEFQRLKADLERERESWKLERHDAIKPKKPFDDVQNQKNTIPLPTRYHTYDETPCRVSSSRRSQDQNIPPVSSTNAAQLNASKTGSAKRLASKSNPNLGSAMKGVVLTESGIELETPVRRSEDIPPVPALPPLLSVLNDPKMMLESPEPARQLSASDTEVPRNRLRRRSTISAPQRPPVVQSASAPAAIPALNPATLPPAPIYDLNDEENLPSPFMKKTVNVTQGWGSLKANIKKGHGLLGIATANSATANGKAATTSATTGTITKTSRTALLKALKANEEAQKRRG